MLNLTVSRVRIQTGILPLTLDNGLICAVEIIHNDHTLSYDEIRLNHFLSEIVSAYLSISFSNSAYLYFDGYDAAYIKFEGNSPISATLSDSRFPANVTYFGLVELRELVFNLLQQMRAGLLQLELNRDQALEIRHLFRHGGLLLPAPDLR